MLDPAAPTEGLLFFSVLFRSDLFREELFEQRIGVAFGSTFSHTPEFNPLAQYYAKEMGEVGLLRRIFFVSSTSFARENLLSAKLLSLDWERSWSQDKKRMVNVDVGFISPENFILATTKNYAHRIFLGQNIFADLTYQCLDGVFQTLPWTYPDYKDQAKIDFMTWCRSYLLMLSRMNSY